MLGLDARTLGLGGAGSALPDWAPAAIAHNPGSLAVQTRGQAFFFHAPLFEGSRYDALSTSLPTLEDGTFAFSFAQVSTPDVEVRDASNFLLRTFRAYEVQVSAAYARRIAYGLSAGLRGHWYRQKLDDASADAWGADAGLYWEPPGLPWRFSLAGRDLWNTGLTLDRAEERPEPSLLAGVFRDFPGTPFDLRVVFEGNWVRHDDPLLRGGLEAVWKSTASLRAGWDGRRPSLGAGLSWNAWSLDYAASFQQPLGVTHRLSTGLRFGKDVAALARDRLEREARLKAEILEKLKAESVSGFLSRGRELLDADRYEEARREFAKVLAWEPEHAEAQEWLDRTDREERLDKVKRRLKEGRRLAAQGDLLNALVQFQGVLELEPGHAAARAEADRVRARLREESGRAFTRSSRIPPEEARRLFTEGLDLYAAGKFSEALDRWKAIVASDPVQRQIFEYVSRAQVRLEADMAAAERDKAREVRESKIELLQRQAIESTRKGDLEGAVGKWREVLELDPSNDVAARELEKAERELRESRKRGIKW